MENKQESPEYKKGWSDGWEKGSAEGFLSAFDSVLNALSGTIPQEDISRLLERTAERARLFGLKRRSKNQDEEEPDESVSPPEFDIQSGRPAANNISFMGNTFDWLFCLYRGYQDSCALFDGPRNAEHLAAISSLGETFGIPMKDLDLAYKQYRKDLCNTLGFNISHPGRVAK